MADFDESGWRLLDTPHDWGIEALPLTHDEITAAIWAAGTSPLRIGRLDFHTSEGQGCNRLDRRRHRVVSQDIRFVYGAGWR